MDVVTPDSLVKEGADPMPLEIVEEFQALWGKILSFNAKAQAQRCGPCNLLCKCGPTHRAKNACTNNLPILANAMRR